MKSLFNMKGTERAAALLVILGRDVAADIMKHLDEKSIEKLSLEMVRIEKMSGFEKEELFGEFLLELKKIKGTTSGGINRARQMISDVFGEERADELISRVKLKDPKADFEYLNDIEPSLLLSLIGNEETHIIALVLGFLKAKTSAQLLKLLPKDRARDVAVRMAKASEPSAEVALTVAKRIKERYLALEDSGLDGTTGDRGVNSLINIFSHMTSEQERRLMGALDSQKPELSKKIKELIFVFENVSNLSNGDIRILIDELNDDRIIAYALKGSGDDIRFKFLRNMSQNRASDILDEMNLMGAVRMEDIEEARGIITDVMKNLSDNGVIVVPRDGEVYID